MSNFWPRVDLRGVDDCWEWQGYRNSRGYGRYHDPMTRRAVQAHRFAYEQLVGLIAEGMQLDHLCRNRGCVNPRHLEPVTNRQNVLRGVGPSARAARATHCKNGHEYTPENTRYNGTARICKTCQSGHMHRAYWRDPEAQRRRSREVYARRHGLAALEEVR